MESSSFKRSPGEAVQFRLLCPAARTGAIIGKGGSVIRHLQSITGAKIRVIDDIPVPSDARVVLIISPNCKTSLSKDPAKRNEAGNDAENPSLEQKQDQETNCTKTSAARGESDLEELSPGQKGLVRVLERIVFGDDAGTGGGEGDEVAKSETEALCRVLVGGNQVGSVMGEGGRVMEKVRQETGANVRILPKDQIPPCAFPGDEVIQISGNFLAVKKALLSISNSLQDSGTHREVAPFPPRGYPPGFLSADYHHRDYPSNPMPEDARGYNRMLIEEDVVFKLLCKADKVGSLIGKGGSVVRAMENETGASIKVTDASHDSDERVVIISARENSEQRHSPAQDAVIRVHNRLAEIGFEPSAAVVVRLLVQSLHIGCLLGKGGHIITEIRRATGASIRVFQKDKAMKYGSQRDEIVQVVGNLPCVQDALFHITGRLREAIFPIKPTFPSMAGPPFMSPFPEGPPPPFRPRHYPASPGPYHSPVGSFHAMDHSPVPSQPPDHQMGYAHGTDHLGPSNFDHPPYPYGGERPVFDRPPSPRSWTPQAVGDCHPRSMADMNHVFASRNEAFGSENQVPALTSSTVEIVIPQVYLSHVYGENNSNLNNIKQISGANVIVHDPKPGAAEGLVIVSGTSDQAHFAQSLIQAFILCGQV